MSANRRALEQNAAELQRLARFTSAVNTLGHQRIDQEDIWKADVDVPCNLQRVVEEQRVVDINQ